MIKIVIAEDHQAFIDGIKLSLANEPNMKVVGEANDGEELIKIVRLKKPDVVLTDIRMPKCDGIIATQIIKSKFPNVKVIALSMFDQPAAVLQMQKAGASGYIMKNSPLSKVVKAIRTVAENGTFFDKTIIAEDLGANPEEIVLSKREKEILQLIGEGKSSNEISEILEIGKSTVDTHRKNILRKLNIQGKSDLIRFAVERKYDFK